MQKTKLIKWPDLTWCNSLEQRNRRPYNFFSRYQEQRSSRFGNALFSTSSRKNGRRMKNTGTKKWQKLSYRLDLNLIKKIKRYIKRKFTKAQNNETPRKTSTWMWIYRQFVIE